MIIEIATAAAMYLAENVTATAAQSDIPQMRPRAAQPKKQQDPDPYAAMWDPNWISSVTPMREDRAGERKCHSSQSKTRGFKSKCGI
jgi:hypothetical protein